jgi:ABC-2 type transport system permease protein
MIESGLSEGTQERSVEATREALPLLTQRPGVIFWRALRDNLVGILGWGLGYSALIVSVVLLYPILEDDNTLISVLGGLGVLDLLSENYPVSASTLASFAGYLAFQGLGWAPTVLAIYLVPQTLNAVMGEEQRGTLDLLLGTPLPRWRLLSEKVLSIVASLLGVLAIMWLALVISTWLVEGSEISLAAATRGIWHILPITLVITMVTLLISVTIRSPRRASSLAALFVATSFFVRSLADATQTPFFDVLRRFSVYRYYSSIGAIADGIRWGNDLFLIGLALILFAVALYCFQVRDLLH